MTRRVGLGRPAVASRLRSGGGRGCARSRCCCRRSAGCWSSTWRRWPFCSCRRSGASIPSAASSRTTGRGRTSTRSSTTRPIARSRSARSGWRSLVTLTDALIAFPFAYYMARVAPPRLRTVLFVIVLLPLWSSYLARIYAWRLILNEDGALNWSLAKLGLPQPALGVHEHGDVDRLLVHLAPVHDPSRLRGAGADSRLLARGVPRSRRSQLDDVPARDRPAGAAWPCGRLDLHVLPDPWRLHHAVSRRERRLHRERHLPQRARPDEQPALRGGLCDRPTDRDGDLPHARQAARRLRGAL